MTEFQDHTIRFPKGTYDRIKELSEAEHRSFSKQVVFILENALATTLKNKK